MRFCATTSKKIFMRIIKIQEYVFSLIMLFNYFFGVKYFRIYLERTGVVLEFTNTVII